MIPFYVIPATLLTLTIPGMIYGEIHERDPFRTLLAVIWVTFFLTAAIGLAVGHAIA